MLHNFIAPNSIAVIGASDDTQKPGGKIVQNILSKGYTGRLFLINPKASTVQGRPAFPTLQDLPQKPDLAFIAIPARSVVSALTELAELGTKHVIVLSAGFGEVDERGRQEEMRLAQIAGENGILLLGPNCLGVMSPVHAGKFAGLLPDMRPGGIDFISGSGATVDCLIEQAVRRGLEFHTFVTVGNSAQIGVTDALALYDADHGPMSSKFIMLYLEKVGDPEILLKHARSLAAKGCILTGIKSGVTEAGSRAAASHTGAMATSDKTVQALLDKAGIIRVQSRLELVDLAIALVLAKGSYNGRRVCVITDAGGPGVMAADELNRQGFVVPQLKSRTRELLGEVLPPGAGLGNPVDCLPSRTPAQLSSVLEILGREESDALDSIVLLAANPWGSHNWDIYEVIIKAMDTMDIPIFPSFVTAVSSAAGLERFRTAGKCYFEDEVSLARALGRMVNRPKPMEPESCPSGYDPDAIRNLLDGIRGTVSGSRTRQVLAAAGIPVPAQRELIERKELDELAREIPFPWVMKVIGPLHKSDLGGIMTGIRDLTAAHAAWDRLMNIAQATGVMVQQTVSGNEVLLGLSRQDAFGHLVAFGLGGIYAEALGDVHFALAPLSKEEARRLITSMRALRVIEGVRGQAGMDVEVLADLLVRVSLLARDTPRIQEMDINPLKGEGAALLAVDVRIIMQP
ncbi:MAG: acetate--CoA ligase family protein [Deltaproteobacteria bacterium]|nr:acetate--CoA ligase family protein [Deltaproteobacteria bacterium]